ncbi:MAG: hypothetical protein WC856_02545 [Methylococcaceae bacterium]|jgi:hypothetical protein
MKLANNVRLASKLALASTLMLVLGCATINPTNHEAGEDSAIHAIELNSGVARRVTITGNGTLTTGKAKRTHKTKETL